MLPTWSARPQGLITGSGAPGRIVEPLMPCATTSNEPRARHSPLGPKPLLVA